jgi:hypothetical protein
MKAEKMRTEMRFDKFAGSEFEQPKAGPKGIGQEARSTNSPGANLNARSAARRVEYMDVRNNPPGPAK